MMIKHRVPAFHSGDLLTIFLHLRAAHEHMNDREQTQVPDAFHSGLLTINHQLLLTGARRLSRPSP